MSRYFAIDIGGSSAKYALIDKDGTLSHAGSFRTGAELTSAQLMDRLYVAVETAACSDVSGIGISSLGWVEPTSGCFRGGVDNLPALASLCIPALLRQRFHLPVTLRNDADAMALGEMRFGAARGWNHFICVALGTGIGGSIVLNGGLWRGAHCRAGEFCYLDWRPDGTCLERHTSALCMIREAAELLSMPDLDGKVFFSLVHANNKICVQVLRRHMALLGASLANLLIALDVDGIVVGGGISNEKDALLPVLKEEIDARLPYAMRMQYTLVAAQRGNDAALLGAVSDWL